MSAFEANIQFGRAVGIASIFAGFDVGEDFRSTIQNSTFEDFPMTMYASSLIQLDQANFQIINSTIQNIQTLMFSAASKTKLCITNCDIKEIGNHIIYHLEDLQEHSFLDNFLHIMVSINNHERFSNETAAPNGLVAALGGTLVIENCTVN